MGFLPTYKANVGFVEGPRNFIKVSSYTKLVINDWKVKLGCLLSELIYVL